MLEDGDDELVREVVQLILVLYQLPADTKAASARLEAFQANRAKSWPICIKLLLATAATPPSEELLSAGRSCGVNITSNTLVLPQGTDVVQFFAAQTLGVLSQAGPDGLPTNITLEAAKGLLLQLLAHYKYQGSSPVIRQLALSVSASFLFTLLKPARDILKLITSGTLNHVISVDHVVNSGNEIARQGIDHMCSQLGTSNDALIVLLELLSSLPEDIQQSKRLAMTSLERVIVAYILLQQISVIISAVTTVYQAALGPTPHILGSDAANAESIAGSSISAPISPAAMLVRSLCMRCLSAWFEARCRFERQTNQTGALLNALPALDSDVALLRSTAALPMILSTITVAVKHALSERDTNEAELLSLTSEMHFPDTAVARMMSAAEVALCESLDLSLVLNVLRNPDPLSVINHRTETIISSVFNVLITILKLMLRDEGGKSPSDSRLFHQVPISIIKSVAGIFAKLAEVFYPAYLYYRSSCPPLGPPAGGNSSNTVSAEEREKNELLITVMTGLLRHNSLEIRHLALDFWYALVGSQFVQTLVDAELQIKSEAYFSDNDVIVSQQNSSLTLLPAISEFLSTCMSALRWPVNLSAISDTFCFEAWLKFREEAAVNIADTATLIGCEAILTKAGTRLQELLESQKHTEASASQSAADTHWDEVEVCLYFLTTVASRASPGGDEVIPAAIEALHRLPSLPKTSIESLCLRMASSKLILWTAGFIGTDRDLFPKCFSLLHQFVIELTDQSKEAYAAAIPKKTLHIESSSELEAFLTICERAAVTALSTLVPAGAGILIAEGQEDDLSYVLAGLGQLAIEGKLSVENRAALIRSAGAVIQALPIARMQRYHYQLTEALYTKAETALRRSSENRISASSTLDMLKLFFTALESVHPRAIIPPPPPSPNAVILDKSDEARHPLLNILEEFWPLTERAILDYASDELVTDPASHAVIRVFSLAPEHVIRYELFGRFLAVLAEAFEKSLSIFHLSPLRTLLGMFGAFTEEPVLTMLNTCLMRCTDRVLKEIQSTSASQFVGSNPDVIGMAFDCTNAALNMLNLTAILLDMEAFRNVLEICTTTAPHVFHPKVLMTMLLVMERFCHWLTPHPASLLTTANLPSMGKCATVHMSWWDKRGDEKSWGRFNIIEVWQRAFASAKRLAAEGNLLARIVASVTQCTISIFDGNVQWIGTVAMLFQHLRANSEFSQTARNAFHAVLLDQPREIVTMEMINDFVAFEQSEAADSHRLLSGAIQKLADAAEANWQKAKFKV